MSHECFEVVDLLVMDMEPETFFDHRFDPLETDPVDDVLVDRPTLQAVEVLVPPHVSRGKECLVAFLAMVDGSGARDHLPVDA